MNNSNETTAITPSKRISLSSRASKIPQKLAQSTFFSLRPSASTLANNNGSNINGNSTVNDRLSTRIGQMFFRQRTTSESVIKESRSFSTQSLDYSSYSLSLGRSTSNHPSRSLDINPNDDKYGTLEQPKDDENDNNKQDNISIASITSKDNNQIASSLPSSTPYSISSPERSDFYSYYYSSSDKDEFNSNTLFSPLSFTNSSVSSLTDSILNIHITPPSSPMLTVQSNHSSGPITSPTTTMKSSVEELADSLIDRCTLLLDLFLSSYDMTFSHVREIEAIVDQTRILLDACEEPHCSAQIVDLRHKLATIQHGVNNSLYHSSIVDLKDHETSIKALIIDVQKICKKCMMLASNSPSLSVETVDGFKKELPKVESNKLTSKDYKELKPDQIDENATWFRHHFVGKPYRTFIGSLKPEMSTNLPLIETTATRSSTDTTNSIKKRQPAPKRRNSKSLLNSFLVGGATGDLSLNDPENQSIGIISVIQERAKDFSGPGNGAAAILGSQYRIIIRSKEPEQGRYIIHECMAKETQSLLESKGESYKMDKANCSNDRRLRPFMSRNTNHHLASIPQQQGENTNTFSSRMLRAAILSACPNIGLSSFKELSAESTIMAGLEKDLLRFDEIHVPKHYKFGFLTIRDDQTTEEAWFSNTALSDDSQDFLNLMGQKIELKGYNGYAAGLDTKTGESGKYTYVSKWNDVDITFHVAPLMPSKSNDKQQVLRKRHIGNDIVCIVFLEGNQKFNPKAIRSQFLHVYIIVKPEIYDGKRHWRVEVLRNSNVSEFGPALPSPPLFNDDNILKEYLITKLVNAENAALRSDKFSIPTSKARLGLLSTHIQTGLSFHIPQVLRSASTNRLSTNKSSSSISSKQNQQKKPQRPKSVNSKSTSSISGGGSSRLLKEAILDEEKRNRATMASTDIPPMPSISRSTLLQDFKKGFLSSSKKLKGVAGEKVIIRKTSQLKISSTLGPSHQLESVIENDGSGSHPADEMFVGKDINFSSESFISTEQLFSIADTPNDDSKNKTSTATVPNRVEHRPSPTAKSGLRPPNLLISTTAVTTATNMSNGHGPSLSWR